MSWKKKLLIVIGLIATIKLAFILYLTTLPDHFKISASRDLPYSHEAIEPFVFELPRWELWSPWKARDNTIHNIYEGPTRGAGASQSWTSEKSGSGKLTFTSENPGGITYDLEFYDWDVKNTGEFLITGKDDGTTQVTWTMEGNHGLVGKAFWVLLGMDKAITRDFEDGFELLDKAIRSGIDTEPATGGADSSEDEIVPESKSGEGYEEEREEI